MALQPCGMARGGLKFDFAASAVTLSYRSRHHKLESAGYVAMEKVTGIGGLFFRARDPAGLSRWYRDHLGIPLTPENYGDPTWRQQAGPTVFAAFPQDTEYFGRAEQAWMVNFRVKDLGRIIVQLESAGIAVKLDPQVYPNGRFARLHDPEGNPIELWEPA